MATATAEKKTTEKKTPAPVRAQRAAPSAEVVHKFGPAGEVFTRYEVTLRFRDRLMGGTPKRADVIEA